MLTSFAQTTGTLHNDTQHEALHLCRCPVDTVKNSLVYYAALQEGGVFLWKCIFKHSGDMPSDCDARKFPITVWPQPVETRLGTIGMISE